MLRGRCSGIFFSSEKPGGRGRPAAPSRNILNSLLYILIVGCRWCDRPRGPQWASTKISSHRRLKSWHHDETLIFLLTLMECDCRHVLLQQTKMKKQVGPLLEMITVKTGKPGRPPQKPQRIAVDKGCDSDLLMDFLKKTQIPRKKEDMSGMLVLKLQDFK